MTTKYSIVIVKRGRRVEVYSDLKKACASRDYFEYRDVYRTKFNFMYKGWKFYKIENNKKQ